MPRDKIIRVGLIKTSDDSQKEKIPKKEPRPVSKPEDKIYLTLGIKKNERDLRNYNIRIESLELSKLAKHLETLSNCFQIMDRKHREYSGKNYESTGAIGCILRARDKINRILNISDRGNVARLTSKFDSDIYDIINYLMMAREIRNG